MATTDNESGIYVVQQHYRDILNTLHNKSALLHQQLGELVWNFDKYKAGIINQLDNNATEYKRAVDEMVGAAGLTGDWELDHHTMTMVRKD